MRTLDKNEGVAKTPVPVQTEAPANGCSDYNLSRLGGFKYVHPLYLAEPRCESGRYISLKSELGEYLESVKATGQLDYASVFLKDLNNNEWMDINPESTYHPGSLFKVITMITFLKMAESDLSILDKKVAYKTANNPPVQTFNSQTIQPGNTYRIRDLIYYMIVYSDNHATMLLHDYVNTDMFAKIFTDLGLEKPNIFDNRYAVNVQQYSRFISVLFDGGYLTLPASEFAISMLCESDFKGGIAKEIPASVKVAHKFGEAGKPGERELHESAIVYLNGKPYLLTIMTKGRESEQLAEVLAHISGVVYQFMTAQAV